MVGRKEQTESMNVPLMTGAGVSHNFRIPAYEGNPFYVSRLVIIVTCPLPWLAKILEVSPTLG